MAYLAEELVDPRWVDGIYQLETSDPVLGGADGIANRQAKELAKRTQYLKHRLDNLPKAGLKQSGIVQLTRDLDSDSDDLAATASALKALKTLYDGLKAELAATVPPGVVAFHSGERAPAGWLKANGALLSRSAYPGLFAAIGTHYGAGDGRTTFQLPDLRGEFPRFWDDRRGIDAGRGLGTWQGDAIRNITGLVSMAGGFFDGSGGVFSVIENNTAEGVQGHANGKSDDFSFDASRVVPTANENRPRNVALLPIIKI